MDRMIKTKRADKHRLRQIWIAVAILALLFGAAAAWKWTPLAGMIEIDTVATWVVSVRNHPARPIIIMAAYVVGSLLLLPITVLIMATAVVFGPILGSAYSFAGSLLAAAVTYAVGYFLGKDFIRQITGPKWKRVERKISQTGILAVAVMRLLPVAPFTVVNIISGAFQVPLWQYVLGSLLGLAPGILIINLFAHRIESAIQNPGIGSFLLIGALVVVTVLGTLWLRRKFAEKS
jgi:uncharacterized membrane protein YdjX (TVP38/TMEM64 family)